MDIKSRVFLYAAAIRLGKIEHDYFHRFGCSRLLRDVLPVIEKWPELTATAIAFIDSTALAEANGYTRESLILTISAVLDRKKGPLN